MGGSLRSNTVPHYRVYDRSSHEFRDVVGYSVMKGEFTEIVVETDYGVPLQIDGEDLKGLVICESTEFSEKGTGIPIASYDVVQCLAVDSFGRVAEIKGVVHMGMGRPEIYIVESDDDDFQENTTIPMHDCHNFRIISEGFESVDG